MNKIAFLLTFASALAACSGRANELASAIDAGPIAECEAFAAAYQSCLATLGPADLARARVEQTRASLAAQASQGEAARAALREKCVKNLSELKTTCH